jgi:hypothetical protein
VVNESLVSSLTTTSPFFFYDGRPTSRYQVVIIELTALPAARRAPCRSSQISAKNGSFAVPSGKGTGILKRIVTTDCFLKLPDEFDVHECAIMWDFSHSVAFESIREELLSAIPPVQVHSGISRPRFGGTLSNRLGSHSALRR